MEYLAHSTFKPYIDEIKYVKLANLPNLVTWLEDRRDGVNLAYHNCVIGDHYMAAMYTDFGNNNNRLVSIFSRVYGVKLYSIPVSASYSTLEIDGKWFLLNKILWKQDPSSQTIFHCRYNRL